MPKTKVETAAGRCSEHGMAQGVREIPRPHFPFIVYLFERLLARRAPFTCPECGEKLTPT
jgi:hypothetical protein